jgi:hypothetical protein
VLLQEEMAQGGAGGAGSLSAEAAIKQMQASMNQQLGNLSLQVANLQTQVGVLQQQIGVVQAAQVKTVKIASETAEARIRNRMMGHSDALVKVPLYTGALPGNDVWPEGLTRGGVDDLTEPALNALLTTYSLSVSGAEFERKDRLKAQLGFL